MSDTVCVEGTTFAWFLVTGIVHEMVDYELLLVAEEVEEGGLWIAGVGAAELVVFCDFDHAYVTSLFG